MRIPFAIVGSLLGAAALSAGSITGTVAAKGPEGAPAASASAGEYQSRRYSLAERIDYGHLRDFVVYIDQPVAGGAPPPEVTITQRDVSFDPSLRPIPVGTKVLWPNKDEIFHNVFSTSDAKPFDLGLYTKDQRVPELTFDQVGRVDVYCSIHSKMHCIILVLPSRFIAVTDARGRYVLPDVPPGTYKVTAWHDRLPPQSRMVTVPAEGAAPKADFILGLGDLPKY
jgi:plastocyanin